MSKGRRKNRYQAIVEWIFFRHYNAGATELAFNRAEIEEAAAALDIDLPKNIGDAIYSIRYRTPMPDSIKETESGNKEWIIEGVGRSKYMFRLVTLNRIQPRSDLVTRKIPDATPEIISAYSLNDEQAVLAVLRYNRLLDIFLGLAAFSLQNHLRTTLANGSQIEIDELYVGIDRQGAHHVLPVQAKGGSDQISSVQTRQDIQWRRERFEGIRCRAISAQFLSDNAVALFELAVEGDEIKVAEERHYKLVPADDLDPKEIRQYT